MLSPSLLSPSPPSGSYLPPTHAFSTLTHTRHPAPAHARSLSYTVHFYCVSSLTFSPASLTPYRGRVLEGCFFCFSLLPLPWQNLQSDEYNIIYPEIYIATTLMNWASPAISHLLTDYSESAPRFLRNFIGSSSLFPCQPFTSRAGSPGV